MTSQRILALFVLMMASVTIQAATIHVPGDQPTIQEGIDAAVDGDTVLVADGTYFGYGNRNINFLGKAITVTSANGPADCIVDCEGSYWNEGRGFSFEDGEDCSSILAGFTIRNGYFHPQGFPGGGIFCVESSPTIANCIIEDNFALSGGGIYCNNASPIIMDTIITRNYCYAGKSRTTGSGGGLALDGGSPVLINCIITNNGALGDMSSEGGGIVATDSHLMIGNCIISDNSVAELVGGRIELGGGICSKGGTVEITDSTITSNLAATGYGGGIYCTDSALNIGNSIFRDNIAQEGPSIFIEGTIEPVVTWSDVEGGWPGEGNIDADPLFLTGPRGDFYLSQVAAGQPSDSPCVDAGDPQAEMLPGTTRTDEVSDDGVVDMGRHYTNGPLLFCHPRSIHFIAHNVGEPSPAQGLLIWINGVDTFEWSAGSDADWLELSPESGTCIGGVDIVTVNVDASAFTIGQFSATITIEAPEAENSPLQIPVVLDMDYHGLVAGPGPALDNPPLIRVFSPDPYAACDFEFSAYAHVRYGVNVTCGDVDGDWRDEILTGPGPGFMYGPHVRGFEVDGTPLAGLNFLAYGTNRWGVNVAGGDVDGDGYDEIITGAGPGEVFGPHVRGWDYDNTGTVTVIPEVSFFAYGTPKWGVNVSAGDIDGDGYDEIVTGAGPGTVYGPHVRGWNVDGGAAAAMPGISFFAYGTNQFGVNVTCGDVDGDGIDEIVTGPGPGVVFGAHVRGWNHDGSGVIPLPGLSFFAWSPDQVRYGARIHAGKDLLGDNRHDIVVGCGPDPSAGTSVKVFTYTGAGVIERVSLEAFEDMTRGTSVASGRF